VGQPDCPASFVRQLGHTSTHDSRGLLPLELQRERLLAKPSVRRLPQEVAKKATKHFEICARFYQVRFKRGLTISKSILV
jgi:hypothetical protein